MTPRNVVRAPVKAFTQGANSTVVKHSEIFSLVAVPSATSPYRNNWIINPSKSIMPWLNSIARCYDEYHITSLRVHFEPSCPNTVGGQIVLFMDYDPTDDNNSHTFEQFAAMSGAVVSQLYMPCEIRYKAAMTVMPQHRYFCSSDPTPDRLNDCARLWVRTTNCSYLENIGRLVIDYVIEFRNPEAPLAPVSVTTNVKARPGVAPADAGLGPNTLVGDIDNLVVSTQRVLRNTIDLIDNFSNATNAFARIVEWGTLGSTSQPADYGHHFMSLDMVPGFHADDWWADAADEGTYPAEIPMLTIRSGDLSQLTFDMTTVFNWTPLVDGAAPSMKALIGGNWGFRDGVMTLTSDYPRWPLGQVCQVIFSWHVTLVKLSPGDPHVGCFISNPTAGTFGVSTVLTAPKYYYQYLSAQPDLTNSYPNVFQPNLPSLATRGSARADKAPPSSGKPSPYVNLASMDKAIAAAMAAGYANDAAQRVGSARTR